MCLWGNPPHACVRQTTCVLPLHACHFLDTARARCLWPQAGSEAAARQVASREAEKRQESASAALGMRRGLSLDVGADSSAAELLLSADAMLEACPDLEAAKCARVEVRKQRMFLHMCCWQSTGSWSVLARRHPQALIGCRRHADALAAAKQLLPGIDRQYLEAEALWRSGQLAPALASLAAVLADAPGSSKCRDLHALLSVLLARDAAAAAALGQGAAPGVRVTWPERMPNKGGLTQGARLPGRHAACMQLCSDALALPAVAAASGLRARLLERRARTHMALGATAEALTDVTDALAAEPSDAACLHLRLQVRRLCLAQGAGCMCAVGPSACRQQGSSAAARRCMRPWATPALHSWICSACVRSIRAALVCLTSCSRRLRARCSSGAAPGPARSARREALHLSCGRFLPPSSATKVMMRVPGWRCEHRLHGRASAGAGPAGGCHPLRRARRVQARRRAVAPRQAGACIGGRAAARRGQVHPDPPGV